MNRFSKYLLQIEGRNSYINNDIVGGAASHLPDDHMRKSAHLQVAEFTLDPPE
jgi:hypothetical protein